MNCKIPSSTKIMWVYTKLHSQARPFLRQTEISNHTSESEITPFTVSSIHLNPHFVWRCSSINQFWKVVAFVFIFLSAIHIIVLPFARTTWAYGALTSALSDLNWIISYLLFNHFGHPLRLVYGFWFLVRHRKEFWILKYPVKIKTGAFILSINDFLINWFL